MRIKALSKFYLYFFWTLRVVGTEYESIEEYQSSDSPQTSFQSQKRNSKINSSEDSDWRASAKKVLPYIATGVAVAASGVTYHQLSKGSQETPPNRNGLPPLESPRNNDDAQSDLQAQNSPSEKQPVIEPVTTIKQQTTASQPLQPPVNASQPKRNTIVASPASPKSPVIPDSFNKANQHKKNNPSIASTPSYSSEGQVKPKIKHIYPNIGNNSGMQQPSAPPLSGSYVKVANALKSAQLGSDDDQDNEYIEEKPTSGSDMELVTPPSTNNKKKKKKFFSNPFSSSDSDNKSSNKSKKKSKKEKKKNKKKKNKKKNKKKSKKEKKKNKKSNKNEKKKKKKQKFNDNPETSVSELSTATDMELVKGSDSESDDGENRSEGGMKQKFKDLFKTNNKGDESSDDEIDMELVEV